MIRRFLVASLVMAAAIHGPSFAAPAWPPASIAQPASAQPASAQPASPPTARSSALRRRMDLAGKEFGNPDDDMTSRAAYLPRWMLRAKSGAWTIGAMR